VTALDYGGLALIGIAPERLEISGPIQQPDELIVKTHLPRQWSSQQNFL
jgi:hypothetical protein